MGLVLLAANSIPSCYGPQRACNAAGETRSPAGIIRSPHGSNEELGTNPTVTGTTQWEKRAGSVGAAECRKGSRRRRRGGEEWLDFRLQK